ncbi:FAD:protein FMN transferase [Acidothermaceae bacterium B102]|nr:FAD:protein FMN transferase [Acidothermaceae bacterium B102]
MTDQPRHLHVEHCMGTVFTIDVRDPGQWDNAVAEVVALLHQVNATFSTYRSDSDISRFRRAELSLEEADPLLCQVFSLCAQVQQETAGYFTARWRDGIDPTGIVKGWAIERASELLRTHGSVNHGVNGGGDMQLAGEGSPGQPWRVAIADPLHNGRVLAIATGRDLAVATSGTAERGAHIVDPFTGRPATALASVTVVGASLTRVDAYATAAFAMGARALRWLDAQPGVEGLVVAGDGTISATQAFPGTYERQLEPAL